MNIARSDNFGIIIGNFEKGFACVYTCETCQGCQEDQCGHESLVFLAIPDWIANRVITN